MKTKRPKFEYPLDRLVAVRFEQRQFDAIETVLEGLRKGRDYSISAFIRDTVLEEIQKRTPQK